MEFFCFQGLITHCSRTLPFYFPCTHLTLHIHPIILIHWEHIVQVFHLCSIYHIIQSSNRTFCTFLLSFSALSHTLQFGWQKIQEFFYFSHSPYFKILQIWKMALYRLWVFDFNITYFNLHQNIELLLYLYSSPQKIALTIY